MDSLGFGSPALHLPSRRTSHGTVDALGALQSAIKELHALLPWAHSRHRIIDAGGTSLVRPSAGT